MYRKLVSYLMDKKDKLVSTPVEGEEKKWAINLVNIFYSFATNKPRQFGVYSIYARDELNELLSHYEQEFCERAQYLDGEGITKLAQIMYLLKSD